MNSHQTINNVNNEQEGCYGYISQEEQGCYFNYDNCMMEAITEADYQDQLYAEDEQDEYEDDPLLDLIMGVQSYLAEQAKILNGTVTDSPLYSLQYRMYTYIRQRVYDL
ncbi:hypothetical protein RMATCC62417_06613 [Rhizopus microsporus]|nr:hypothetical protein RMATCC62417_06613 [Rhizopus microsporus]CEI99824.1 hypothetical protein RMCBS344292_13904 [Rhizopus microsporus]